MIDPVGQILTIVFSIILRVALIVGIVRLIAAGIILIKNKLGSSGSNEEK